MNYFENKHKLFTLARAQRIIHIHMRCYSLFYFCTQQFWCNFYAIHVVLQKMSQNYFLKENSLFNQLIIHFVIPWNDKKGIPMNTSTKICNIFHSILGKYLLDNFKIAFTLLISRAMNEHLAWKSDQTKVKLFFEEGKTICHVVMRTLFS